MNKDHCHTECDHRMIVGNSIDVQITDCDCDMKADIVVSESVSVRLWGQVKNYKGQPVPNALLTLLKEVHKSGACEYQGVSHTVSDCKGFYQFDLSTDELGCSYRVLASRAIDVPEKSPCHTENCNPCTHQSPPHKHCPPCTPCTPCTPSYECRPSNKNCNCR